MKASKSSLRNPQIIPTGLPKLDDLLDGGISMRHITQFSGRYSTGKSTIALGIIANAQKQGLDTLWLDSEQRYPFDYSERLGINLDRLDLEDKKHAEDLFNTCEEWVEKHKGVIILDSIGGLLTRKEAEKRSGEESYPEAPKLIPGFIRRIVIALALNDCALVLLNHEKIDFMSGAIKVLGGRAVEFHSDKWIRLRQLTGKKVMQGEKRVGDIIEASVQKGPKRGEKCELILLAGKGFSIEADRLKEMLDNGSMVKQGRTFYVGDTKIGVGEAAAREWLKQHGTATL